MTRTQTAYCSACDRDVQILVTDDADHDAHANIPDAEVVCLEIGDRCTGSLCPVGAVSHTAMVNASDDERLPRSSVDALYAAAGQPKEQLWMAGAHIHGDSATINRLVGIVIPRVRSTP